MYRVGWWGVKLIGRTGLLSRQSGSTILRRLREPNSFRMFLGHLSELLVRSISPIDVLECLFVLKTFRKMITSLFGRSQLVECLVATDILWEVNSSVIPVYVVGRHGMTPILDFFSQPYVIRWRRWIQPLFTCVVPLCAKLNSNGNSTKI